MGRTGKRQRKAGGGGGESEIRRKIQELKELIQ
jgi:hypothetical protein